MSKRNSTETPTRSKVSGRPCVVYESSGLTEEDIAQASQLRTATFARDTAANGVLVADGAGLRIATDRGALVVEDGVGESRRTRRFDKATHRLNRVVVLGSSGSVSIEALHWARRLGIAVLVLAPDGSASLASTPRSTNDARLRRMQSRASDLPVGLDIARELISRKLHAQADLLSTRFGDADADAALTVAELAADACGAGDVDELRQIEASGAALYWQSWAGRPECEPRFVTRDLKRIPPHWTRFEGRSSVLASMRTNRKAERPVNAALNYLYALLEAEAILACHVVGLDPGFGLVHSDTRGRASFALGLMEPVRPAVDRFVLDLLERRTFRKAEFTETADGHCRLLAPLTHELAETLPTWAKALAPYAESAAHSLGQAIEGKYAATTPLTTRRSRDAAAKVRARSAATSRRRVTADRSRQAPAAETQERWCLDCGGRVYNARHIRCTDCIDADPRQTPEIRGRRAQAIASRKRALVEWDRANPGVAYDPERYRREILPGLGGVKLAAIMEAADISKGYASQVRAGKYTPHVSTWKALAELARTHNGLSRPSIGAPVDRC